MLLLAAISLLDQNLIHFDSKLLQLAFEFDVLIDEFSFAALRINILIFGRRKRWLLWLLLLGFLLSLLFRQLCLDIFVISLR
jgi:hypothetical protein